MSKATIGRNVLLIAAASLISSIGAAFVVGKLVQHDPAQPFTATITYVHSDSLVNLVVHDHNGHSHALTSVQLLQPDAVATATPGTTYAYWPDYSAGQAAAVASTVGNLAAASSDPGAAALNSGAATTGDQAATTGTASASDDAATGTAATTGAVTTDPSSGTAAVA